MEPAFSIQESLKFGWQKTRAHSRLLFAAVLTLFAVRVAYAIVEKILAHTPQGIAAEIILTAASIWLGVGLVSIALKLAKGERAVYADLLPPLPLVWQFLAVSVLAGLMIVGGLILLVIPGIYFLLRFFMVRFAVLEGVGIIGSLRKSTEITMGVKWDLFWFLLVIIGVNIIGALLFFVGLLVTVPMTMIAHAHVYRKLLGRSVEA